MLLQFVSQIHKLVPQPTDSILVAVSGGVDSMVLLHVLQQTDYPLAVAHCNYQLREQAEQETTLVREYCEATSIPFHSIYFDTKKELATSNESLQMVARKLRYQFFEDLCSSHAYQWIATAHHADDNLESILLNLTKGTGIRGMIGIAPKNENLIRPLLQFTKEEIRAYAKMNHIPFLEDESNATSDYQRNKIRNEVIPILQSINPKLIETSQKSIQNHQFAYQLFTERMKRYQKKLIHTSENQMVLFRNQIISQPNADKLLFELLRPFGFSQDQIETFYDLLTRETIQPSEIYSSHSHQACIDNKARLIIQELQHEMMPVVIHEHDREVKLDQKQLIITKLEQVPKQFTNDASTIFVNADELEFPLQVRIWAAGDYFYPFGLGKKKKVSKFLINEKVNKLDKANQLVLTSGQKIVWVIGRRMDHRFACRETSQSVLKIEYQSSK